MIATQQICPALSCDLPISTDLTIKNGQCFQHSGDSPVTYIRTYQCANPQQLCMLVDGEYAWTRAIRQNNSTLNRTNRDMSQVYQKITQKNCEDIESSQQGLQSGRKCELHAQCISKNCDAGSRRCVGKAIAESCETHQDCDVNLGCLEEFAFPYKTTCQNLKTTNDFCYSDFDCQPTHMCWYRFPTSTRTQCLEMYSIDTFIDIGNIRNTSLSVIDQSIYTGRLCKSGVAFITNDKTARCVEISNITTNIDNYATNQQAPFLCSLTAAANACRYNYIALNGTIRTLAEDYCECSLQNQLNSKYQGVCPFPGQEQVYKYVNASRITMQNTNCSSLDRYNMYAQNDCGAGGKGGELYDNWALAVEAQFNMTYWPFIQSNQTNTCMNQVMAISRLSIDKSHGVFGLTVSLISTFVVISLIALIL
eukprot:403334190